MKKNETDLTLLILETHRDLLAGWVMELADKILKDETPLQSDALELAILTRRYRELATKVDAYKLKNRSPVTKIIDFLKTC